MSKAKSFGMQQVQFAVSSAISEFNSEAKFHTCLLESMNISPGTYTTLYCEELDKQRICSAQSGNLRDLEIAQTISGLRNARAQSRDCIIRVRNLEIA